MLPQARLTARLLSIDAVTTIVGQNVLPVLVPGTDQYPAVVFQVLEDHPDNDSTGSSDQWTMQLRVACIGLSQGPLRPYETVWQLAAAVAGLAEDPAGPTGLSGWKDDEGSIWHLMDEFDEAGEVMAGTDTFWAYVVNQLYEVQYVRS
jgi:hypothetical protein